MQSEPLKEHSPAGLWSDFKEGRLGMRIGLGLWSEDSLTGKEEKQPGRQSKNEGVRREGKLLDTHSCVEGRGGQPPHRPQGPREEASRA